MSRNRSPGTPKDLRMTMGFIACSKTEASPTSQSSQHRQNRCRWIGYITPRELIPDGSIVVEQAVEMT